jgi:hypothetical protein
MGNLFDYNVEIDIEDKIWYGKLLGYSNEITRERLIEIKAMGYKVCGVGQFGIPKITSGLYIEWVWSYDDKAWNLYINWVKTLINK